MFSKPMSRRFHMGSRGGRGLVFALGILNIVMGILAPAHAAQLTLTWSDTSTNEQGFKVERKTGTNGAYGLLTSLAADTAGYVDTTVTAGTTYCYRVRAYNGAGDSAYSNEDCAAPASATLHTVTVGKAGTGSGTVTSSPSDINCGSTCSTSIASGTSIALSATPAAGSTFTGWSGACVGTGGCALVVNGNKSVTATFTSTSATTAYTLTLAKGGTGTGTVTSSPTGIACGTDCSQSYTSGATVTLTAAPAAGSTFTGWTGYWCTGTSPTCRVTMSVARWVGANFGKSATTAYTLTLAKGGTGTGTVTSSPTGIACGTDCSQSYTSGATVTLTAAPAAGSTFTGWTGYWCTGTSPTCRVTMSVARWVGANFGKSATTAYTLTLAKGGTGTGTVTSSPTGIACGTDCSQSYTSGATVTLTAAPAAGSTFTGWTGYWCTGTSPTCRVTMGNRRWVSATFTKPTQ